MNSYDFGAGPADMSKPCLPDRFTPLFHTSSWKGLDARERLRYNQLHALYFNEQLAFFEDGLADRLLAAALRLPLEPALSRRLSDFLAEEERHTDMFRRLNRLYSPALYESEHYRFVKVGAAGRALLDWAASKPALFPLFIWVMLLQEERAVYYSREIIRSGDALEPHFVAAHRLHLADEAGHVRYDEDLIALFWAGASPRLRAVNARLLRWALAEFFNTPKRGTLSVLDELCREFPRLAPEVPGMKREMLALTGDEDYERTLYSRGIVPKAFSLLDQWPELAQLSKVMMGYRPGEAAA
ncbi:MAG: diiron oxygenase [Elusimicrobia bacterium]|nr:diiron oxygenase [Elusimicrobiota bacterium]